MISLRKTVIFCFHEFHFPLVGLFDWGYVKGAKVNRKYLRGFPMVVKVIIKSASHKRAYIIHGIVKCTTKTTLFIIIVSTGCIWWILWFCVGYDTASSREIFDVNALSGKLDQLASPNLLITHFVDGCVLILNILFFGL